jgi:tetratricopeptide (TPR) repeat protein
MIPRAISSFHATSVLVLLLSALAGCSGPSPAPPSASASGLKPRESAVAKDLEHAEKLLRDGAGSQAIPTFDRILKTVDLAPELEIRALLGRCDARLDAGATAEAFADARSAESRWKSFRRRSAREADALAPELDRALGDCALFMKDARTARQRYEKALAKPSRLADADAVRFKLWAAATLARDADAATLAIAVNDAGRPDLVELASRLGVAAAESKGTSAPVASTSSGGNALPGVTVLPRVAWNAKVARAKDLEPMTRVHRVTVHHSGEVTNVGNETDVANLLRAIQNTHQNGERYADIGYHFLIDARGRIWQGRDLRFQGAHAGNGALNAGNVGVCLLGDFDKQSLPVAQAKALVAVLDALRKRYGVRRENVYGHGEIRKLGGIGGTECPGDRVQSLVANYRKGKT